MPRSKRSILIAVLLAALTFSGMSSTAYASETLSGTLNVIWGDNIETGELITRYFLDQDGVTTELTIDDALLEASGGVYNLYTRPVQVEATPLRDGTLSVTAIELDNLRDTGQAALSGAQPFITLMCQFPGDDSGTSETAPISYFNNMYSDSYPGMGDYWRDVSYNQINVNGSTSSGWHTMPHSQSYYMNAGSPNLSGTDSIFEDCVAASGVNVYQYEGVNIMLDEEIGCCAWGGSTGAIRATWNPPWAWQGITVIAHEMGHAFGLPHSNNYDSDINPYDNPWDVMSGAYNSSVVHPTYGRLGLHTNAAYKDQLNWMDNTQFVYPGFGEFTIALDALGYQNPTYNMIALVGSSGTYYTAESRRYTGDYEVGLQGNLAEAVIIYDVNYGRAEPAWLVGGTTDANSSGAPSQWTTGETWTSPQSVPVTVNGTTSRGHSVTVGSDTSVLANGSIETQPSGSDWNVISSGEGWLNNNQAYDGSHAMVFQGNGATELMRQTVNTSGTIGDGAAIVFYVAGLNVANGGGIGGRIEFMNGGSPVNAKTCIVSDRGGFNWKQVICIGSAMGSFDAVRVTIGWQNVSSGTIGFDAVELFVE